MVILVINAGSSSLKYQLIDMDGEKVLGKGICERIGAGGKIIHKTDDGRVISYESDFPTHTEAFKELIKVLTSGEGKVLENVGDIAAIGHRVVQGAEKFYASVLLNDEMISEIEEVSDLAPLHNPANVLAIRACREVFGNSVPQAAVFDTAFHQTMPEKAYIFPIPYEYYEKYHIRRYGFHGTSHRFVSARLAELTGRNDLKIVTCHLGNGSSITAINAGKSVDTSMGFTPLDGIIMGTRSGGIDPSVVSYIAQKENLTAAQVVDILNKKSGYLGVSGFTSDNRDLLQAAEEGNARAQLATDLQRYQIKKYIGAYAAAMGGLDAVIFTGGIGENSPQVRETVCADMKFMGIGMDNKLNVDFNGKEKNISAPGSKVQVWIIPTNEELLIARDTRDLLTGK